ncbi:hypothetical protein Poli38472_010229 [Pythium oligandrum]|uniref:5'-3' exonuclease domain-containing protein n=1 Tax=Pythium oligandrum TaxID=41045 RepID=A0A8K1C9C3_PYTOL|nr:hypothetical protein Poli38472_010229 [Pythium oligandrum]|eukprot:TMW58670.1 hypothetical protein Poli38472_010229 [Pythium oligandrum]
MRPAAWQLTRQTLVERTAAIAKHRAVFKRRRKAILVDGNNILYHFYNPLCTNERDGEKSGAIEGMIGLLGRMDTMHRPQHICVFFDKPQQTTVRKVMDPTYKRNRRPTPRALRPQLVSVTNVLQDVNVNCIACSGIEADDLIASYTESLHARDFDVLVVSNDNDFLQLARGQRRDAKEIDAPIEEEGPPGGYVEIYQPNKRRYLLERHMRSRYGVAPLQIPSFIALCGHPWGKIPRVNLMTDEIAVELLTKYESLPKLLRNLNEVEDPLLRKSLKQSISSIESSYRIAKLQNDLQLPIPIDELLIPDWHAANPTTNINNPSTE